nr:integrase, catalytic region, zinc finger, CCHC-type, peptidase aspartic, catalytic [Tanacetum cinerariifolium]
NAPEQYSAATRIFGGVTLMVNISNYGSDVVSESGKIIDSQMDDLIREKLALKEQVDSLQKKAQQIKPTLYDGIIMSDKHVAMTVNDDDETLILEENSRSKMSEKAKDQEIIDKNISHKPIDYAKLNRLSEDFRKRFTLQKEKDDEQAFWLRSSNPTIEQVKAKQPLDNALDFACKHAQLIQELLVYVQDTCPNAIKPSAKKVVVTPKNKVKKVRVAEPLTSACNIKQIVHWYLDSGCLKHMTGNHSQLINFISKFFGTVRFENGHITRIVGYGDYQLGNVTISRVYYVEGLGHNLFSACQFCNADLEVTFQKNTSFIRNLEGVDLISRSRDTNLYAISLDDMLKTSPICLLLKASKTKSWLWHRRLSHLNFGKSKKSSHQPKAEDTNKEKLYLFHMDLCGLVRVTSKYKKKYILVIVDDYSRLTWVRFSRSKYEAPEATIKCIKNIQVCLNATVRNVQTSNGTEFVNQTLREFYENVGIPHQTSAEAINTACYTQNRSIIHHRYNKNPYELIHDKKPDVSFFHVFGALCYPTNDNEYLGKLDTKDDIGIFVGYVPAKKAFRIYNKRTWKIVETIHVPFDELISMASEQFSSGPGLQCVTPATSSSGLVPNTFSQQPCIPPNRDD